MEPKVRAKINEHIATFNKNVVPNPHDFFSNYETTVWAHGEEYPFKNLKDEGFTVIFENSDDRLEVCQYNKEGKFKDFMHMEEIKHLDLLDESELGDLDESYQE